MVPGTEQRHFESFDGTVIGYQIRGPESAPGVVFANGLGEHDARDVLPEIDIPTLIITGDTDYLTPVFTAEMLHRAIRGSRMVVIKGGTHYAPVEFPSAIQEELFRFLARITGIVPPAFSVSAKRAAGG